MHSAGSVFLLHIMAALHPLSYLTPRYTGPGKRAPLQAGAHSLATSQHVLSSAVPHRLLLLWSGPSGAYGSLPNGLSLMVMSHCRGQILEDAEDGKRPAVMPCQVLDFELEMVSAPAMPSCTDSARVCLHALRSKGSCYPSLHV